MIVFMLFLSLFVTPGYLLQWSIGTLDKQTLRYVNTLTCLIQLQQVNPVSIMCCQLHRLRSRLYRDITDVLCTKANPWEHIAYYNYIQCSIITGKWNLWSPCMQEYPCTAVFHWSLQWIINCVIITAAILHKWPKTYSTKGIAQNNAIMVF